MDKKRKTIEIEEYIVGSETGWETLRKVTKLDKPYLEYVLKEFVGKSLFGKVFRVAYIENENGKFWIIPKKTIKKVKLIPDAIDNTIWKWQCPDCCKSGLKFSYSKEINYRYGIPNDRVYCAICGTFYAFEKEEREDIITK